MKTALIAIAILTMIGALPAAAGAADTSVQTATSADSTPYQATYIQRARSDMQEWQKKLKDFSERTAAEANRESNAADNDLKAAWAKTQVEAGKLQTASADGWENAKISFEKASRELSDAWDKIRPQDK
jgi:small-conductance mechanosensitive channel